MKLARLVMLLAAFAAQAQTLPPNGHLANINGAEIYYETRGQGSPLVLLHPFTASTDIWAPFAGELAKSHRVIVIDQRGHGRSTNPTGVFTHRQSALDVFALLDQLGIRQFKGAGMSSGGMTLLHMATKQPSRVEAMVLIGATHQFVDETRAILRAPDCEASNAEDWERMRGDAKRGDEQIRALLQQFCSFKDSYEDMNFTPPLLSTITARTLIVHGDRDEYLPVRIPVEMYTSIPRSYLWIVPNGGHLPVFGSHRAELIRIASAFFAGKWEKPAAPSAEEAVRTAHAERFALMVKNDLAALAPRLAEDLVYVHSRGDVETKAQFLERLRSGGLRYRTIEPSDTVVRTYGDVAMVTGRAKAGVTDGGGNRDVDMRYTAAYRRSGDRWQLVSWQSTTIAPAPVRTEHRIVPIRSMSEDVEVVYGDPDKPGEPFVMRIRELAGGVIPPHKHPVDEHITVVQGTLYFAVGDTFDKAVMKEMKAGSYAFIPKGSTMFGYTPEAAIVQVHGVGPFHIHWRAGQEWRESLTTLDSPNAASVFKFKRGQRVSTERGRGRIRQGYDSGELVGYEIDGDDGTLFMALESEIEGR